MSKPTTYTSVAASLISKLRKRPFAKNETDIGIDGEWVEQIDENKLTGL